MILCDYKDFPIYGRILGLDWGQRRCGVAISDENRGFVFVRDQINVKTQDELLNGVLALLDQEKIVGIVLGLPLHADGSDSETTVMVRSFADSLSKKTDLPIIFIEENLTSAMAEQKMTRKTRDKIKTELDSLSAKIILENAIAMLKRI
jgi:putative Holliday junction resolvase